jgi:uncharacterized membrane protein YraQ (UPF0718 family)
MPTLLTKRNTSTPLLVLFGVALILGAFRLFSGGVVFPQQVQDFLTLGFSVVLEALPFVILGVFLSSVFQVFIPVDRVFAILPKNPFLRRIVLSFVGFLLPVCECGNVPLARGMMVKGFTVADATVFLFSAPVVNPVTLFTTFSVFGWDDGVLVGRVLGVLVVAHLLGWLFSLHPASEKLLTDEFAAVCAADDVTGTGSKVSRFARSFSDELGKLLPLLVFGGFVAAGIQVLLPRDMLFSVGQHVVLSLLVMVVLGVVVAVCSTVDAFFALTFLGLFLPGSILVFLIVGPLMDVKMLVLLKSTFRLRTVLLMSGVVVSVALLFGVVVNSVFA